MQNLNFGGVSVLAIQLFNKIKRKKKMKNLKKHVSLYFPHVMSKIHFFGYFLYVLDIYVTRNGNNLKLKVKSEFSLSKGLMLINHSNPYNYTQYYRTV